MRVLLVCAVLSVVILVASGSLTCFMDEEKCGEGECCIQVGTTIAGICKKVHEVDEVCEMKPAKNLIKKHVYRVRCPCKDGLKCISSKGGLIGKFAGKCQVDSGEVTEE